MYIGAVYLFFKKNYTIISPKFLLKWVKLSGK